MRIACLGILAGLLVVVFMVGESDAWTGHTYTIRKVYYRRYLFCGRRYWRWGCCWWSWGKVAVYYYQTACLPGWRHNGNQNCNIPICLPSCANGGTCSSPNVCDCPTTSQGPGCRTLEPTYFESSNSTLAPVIGKSMVTLANIRRSDNRENFMFVMDGTDTDFTDILWSNQDEFNTLKFEIESLFVQPEELPERPSYVHDAKMGVVHSQIEANVSKIARNGGIIRDFGSFKTYECNSGFSKENPALEVAECEIDDDQFVTNIEHGDWLTVTFQSTSGGFQDLINLDLNGRPYATKYYNGLKDIKQVQFKFDFIAPKHCTEKDAFSPDTCQNNAHILKVDKEFTKSAINATWLGWQDDLSGMWEYYVEIFKLSPDPYDRLVEMTPLAPVFNENITHEANIAYPVYTPNAPGMYSVMLECRDFANNSKTARRLVLFDDQSNVEVSNAADTKLYVSSAVEETGYSWQTVAMGQNITFVVNWDNHFINRIHADGKLLNQVLPYPIQFKDIADDGLLFSNKYVNESLDDYEGQRTRAAIANFNGIIKFEMAKEYTQSMVEPTNGWTEIIPLAQSTSFTAQLSEGSHAKIWIRATDAMGNTAADNTVVRVDSSPPVLSNAGQSDVEHRVELNIEGGMYNYTSRILFVAVDDQSGVHKLGFNIMIHTPGKPDRKVFTNSTTAQIGLTTDNPTCRTIDDTCFLIQQRLELNNCWFLVNKADLVNSNATVDVIAYNQALLTTSTTFEIGSVTQLKGLEKYSGPTNIRIASKLENGFVLTWDLPETPSCYGVADIVIVITRPGANGPEVVGEYVIFGTQTRLDVLGLNPQTEYGLSLGLRVPGGGELQTDTSLKVTTLEQVETGGPSIGLIVGIVLELVQYGYQTAWRLIRRRVTRRLINLQAICKGLLVLFGLTLLFLFVLVRRGVIKPAERARTIRHAVSTRVRRTVYGGGGGGARNVGNRTYGYDNRQSELYIYGGMDEGPQIWHLDRNDVIFENLIKSGHFANIYQAKLTGQNRETVVAKTLKEGHKAEDKMLMKAKINFTGTAVGDHPNVLKFIGAYVGDDAMGPFIIYEFCENGTLKEYLEKHKNNVSIEVQDSLFRFGLDMAKGMEYLAGKGVVHRRLAARNILLTFTNDVKISGFGPQPQEEEDGTADQGKKERIPIKWMAPECMSTTKDATEKSDVWSYAVVLWEMFSMGDTPYSNIRSRDLESRIKKGERLSKPETCDDTWYDLMRKCWAIELSKRPTFTDIRSQLDTLFVASDDDFYYYQR